MRAIDVVRAMVPAPLRSLARRGYASLPPQLRADRRYRRLRSFLDDAQWWDRERIETWQIERLRGVIHHAWEHVPGYRTLFRGAGVTPDDIRSLDDVRRLPFTTKEMIRDNLEDFTARDIPSRQRTYVTTGGSTGIPFGFYRSRVNTWMEPAFLHSGWARVGWRPGDSSAVLRGAFVGSKEEFYRYDPWNRGILLSTYHLTEDTYTKYIEKLLRCRPRHLQAYPSAAVMLADLVLKHGDVGRLNFEVILLGSENFHPWQEERIRRGFPSARLYCWYGQAEQAVLAGWCEEAHTYHSWPFYGLTEVIGEDGSEAPTGASGEVVATSFWNAATPFIRYRTMDRAVKGRNGCEKCGRSFLILDDIEGRVQEFVVTATGRHISMTAVNMHTDIFDNVRQFQFHQETPGVVTLNLVRKDTYTADDSTRIHAAIAHKLGEDMELRLAFVDDIPRTASGKLRFLLQELDISD